MLSLQEMTNRNNEHNYCAFNNNKNKNILFIGSCRILPFLNYYNAIDDEDLKRNIYGVLVHTKKRNYCDTELKEKIREILVNTDIIVSESLKAFDFLNSNPNTVPSIYSEFDLSNKRVFIIPNLVLVEYHSEIFNTFKVEHKDANEFHIQSYERFRNKCISLNYHDFWEKIDKYHHTVKLFATHNHPTRVLSLLLFKYFVQKIKNIVLPLSFFEYFMKIKFLEGNDIPIFQIDVDTYDIKYPYVLTDDSLLHTPNIYAQPISFDRFSYDIFN